MAFNAGKLGGVLINNVAMKFDTYKVDLGTDIVEFTNFLSPGQKQELLAGIGRGAITISGPYDVGGMAIAAQTIYAFVLQLNQLGATITMSAIVEKISIDNSAKDMARINVTIRSTGDFAVAIS